MRLPRSAPTPIDGLRKASIDSEIAFARPEPPELPLPAKPSPARLLLVRHGQSTWNREHRIQGQLDPPLSTEGRRQAMQVARRLAGRRLAGFYSSDLKRAFETAGLIGEAVAATPSPSEALREIYLGLWEGLNDRRVGPALPEGMGAV